MTFYFTFGVVLIAGGLPPPRPPPLLGIWGEGGGNFSTNGRASAPVNSLGMGFMLGREGGGEP